MRSGGGVGIEGLRVAGGAYDLSIQHPFDIAQPRAGGGQATRAFRPHVGVHHPPRSAPNRARPTRHPGGHPQVPDPP